MATIQDRYDEAMFEFSTGNYVAAIDRLKAVLAEEPSYFDAQLSLGMAYCRIENYAQAIAEGHTAEKMRPKEPLVHTNLSLFYMKSGDKTTAEHHGLQARIASWRNPDTTPTAGDTGLEMAKPPVPTTKPPDQFPDMPWKKNRPLGGSSTAD